MHKVRLLSQSPTGCGISCIAMVANKNRKEVTDLYYKIRNKSRPQNTHCTNFVELQKLAIECGISLSRKKKFKSWDSLPDRAILSINYHGPRRWHWVVFVRTSRSEYILDSGIYKKRVNFDKIRPRWYMEVSCE